MTLLQAAQEPGVLLAVVTEHSRAFTAVATSAALHRLSRLAAGSTSRDWEADPGLRELLALQELHVTVFRPRNLANSVYAFARLRLHPSPEWLSSFVAAAAYSAAQMDAQQTANTLWALGTLAADGCGGGEGALGPLSRACLAHASAGTLSPQHAANSWWAFAKLKHRPETPLYCALCAASAASAASASSAHLVQTTWALAALAALRPASAEEEAATSELLAALAVASRPLLASAFSPSDLSLSLWAYASLGVSPGGAWLAAHESASTRALALGDPRTVSTTLLGWSRLGHTPRHVTRYGAALRARLRDAEPQSVSNSLCSFGMMALSARRGGEEEAAPVQPETLRALCAWSQARLGSFKPTELAQSLWGLAALGFDPGPMWRGACLAACLGPAGGLRRFSPPELSSVLWALASLGASPGPPFLASWAEAAEAAGWERFELRHAVNTLWALAVLSVLGEAEGGAMQRIRDGAFARLADAAAVALRAAPSAEAEPALAALMAPQSWCAMLQAALLLAPEPRAEDGPGAMDGERLLAAAEACFPMPPPCWAHAAAAWRLQAAHARTSSLQLEVSAVLWRGLGVPHQTEARTEGGLATIDIAITPPGAGRPVALEVDGPSHFLNGSEPGAALRQRGGTLLRDRLLTRLGWRLVVLPFADWPADFDARVEVLRTLVSPVLQRRKRPGVVARKRPAETS